MSERFVVTTETAEDAWMQTVSAGEAGFGDFRKKITSRISNFTVPAGTPFATPEGLKAEDEQCRIAFDVRGGVYPIRESVFQESYELAPPPERETNAD